MSLNGSSIYHRHGADAGDRHRRDYFDFYVSACSFVEVAPGSESRRIVPFRERISLLLPGRVQSRKRVLPYFHDLYKYFRENTKGFSELAAFPAFEPLFGVRRSGSREAAQSCPGEYVSGNYFTMFGIRAYVGRLLTAADDQAEAQRVQFRLEVFNLLYHANWDVANSNRRSGSFGQITNNE